MHRSKPIPAGFAEDFVSLTRHELQHRYSLDQRSFRELAAKMPAAALSEREYRSRTGRLAGSRVPIKKAEAPDKPAVQPLADPAAAAARLAHLIELQKQAQAKADAEAVDPYAGLTGLDRQIAIAKVKGVTVGARLPSRSIHAADLGIGMSSAAWAVLEGGR